jgi:hypothetical protein
VPDYKLNISSYEDEESFSNQWGLKNSGQIINKNKGKSGVDINVKNA